MLVSRLSTYITVLLIYLLSSPACKKPEAEQPAVVQSAAPVAKAGEDATIYMPDQYQIQLDGSKSYDPDGPAWALFFTWRQIGGPSAQIYPNSNYASKKELAVSKAGKYDFELTVYDRQGNESKDSVTITAIWGSSCIPGMENITATFPVEKAIAESVPIDVSYAGNGRYLAFGGGRTEQNDGWGGGDVFTDKAYVYDIVNKTTVSKILSEARGRIGIAVTDQQVFFAGGILLDKVSDVVDIYDISTNTLSKARLSTPRSSVATVVAGTRIFFAGGRNQNNEGSDVVDIYNTGTKSWSTARLSQARAGISAIASGTKVFFAGGDFNFGASSGRIDVYDLNSGQWSTAELPYPRTNISAAILDKKVVFAGGMVPGNDEKVNQVDFFDPASMTFLKSECLIARSWYDMAFGQNTIATVVNTNELFYLNNALITRLRSDTRQWSLALLPETEYFFGLVSDGKDLFGLSSRVDDNSSGYVGRINIHRISF